MSKLKYDVGADFLCRYADGMIYEAKCVELDTSKKSPLYFVHYKGWNNRWDEWVDDSRLLELNAANRKQAETNNVSWKAAD